MTREEIQKVLTAISTQYWKINYFQFLAILDLSNDDYAQEKWDAWYKLNQSLAELGDLLPILVMAYEQH